MLKNHYLIEDWPQVLDNIETVMNASVAMLNIAENGEFSSKNEQLAKINRSMEIIQALNRKKVDRSLDDKAVALVRDWY